MHDIKNILLKAEKIKSLLDIKVYGWVRSKRDGKDICFIELNDGSIHSGLQAIVNKSNNIIINNILSKITTGCSVCLFGDLVESPAKGQNFELQVKEIELIGSSDDDYPLQKKKHSFEFLREIAHLRVRSNTFGAITRVRSALAQRVHGFFAEKNFIYVNTPIITGGDCEGAGEIFRVTTLDTDEKDLTKDFFGKEVGLTVSGQLSAETYAMGMSKVYTFGPTFRAENSNTARHLAEFWMLEPEVAFCGLQEIIKLSIELLKDLINHVLTNCQLDMEFFDKRVKHGVINELTKVVEAEFKYISYTEAINILTDSDKQFEHKVSWGEDLATEHEKYLADEVFKSPVVVTDYPKDIKAFYMKVNDDGKTVAAMDILFPKLGEMVGGSAREDDYLILINRMKKLNLDIKDYSWYLDLRRYGSVPHAGFGLGFERLVQYVTGMSNIRDVIPYPRTVNNCEF